MPRERVRRADLFKIDQYRDKHNTRDWWRARMTTADGQPHSVCGRTRYTSGWFDVKEEAEHFGFVAAQIDSRWKLDYIQKQGEN